MEGVVVSAKKAGTTITVSVDLLPRGGNIRRVFVDDRNAPVTIWVGSNLGAAVVKIEPLD